MGTQLIDRHFARIGARVKVIDLPGAVRIDIARDRHGDYFELTCGTKEDRMPRVVDVQPRMRHLLLIANGAIEPWSKHKFLCGHDERHWFVAAVPEKTGVSSVKTAMEALKPSAVRWMQNKESVKTADRLRRRNAAYVRQGEWFFLPMDRAPLVQRWMVLRNEPIRRGNGKPHVVEELVRFGGETVYVSRSHPNGVNEVQYRSLLSRSVQARSETWAVQRRNPIVFVRGKIRHADHTTIVLPGWHRVLMNTETESVAMRHVAFID